MVLVEFLAQALAKYQEDEPWETLAPEKQARCRRLGALLAAELTKLSASQLASPASHTPSAALPTSATPDLPNAALALSRDQAVEVSVAVPVTVGGQRAALSPETVQNIFQTCLKQLGAAA